MVCCTMNHNLLQRVGGLALLLVMLGGLSINYEQTRNLYVNKQIHKAHNVLAARVNTTESKTALSEAAVFINVLNSNRSMSAVQSYSLSVLPTDAPTDAPTAAVANAVEVTKNMPTGSTLAETVASRGQPVLPPRFDRDYATRYSFMS